jgi:hypothetical protein
MSIFGSVIIEFLYPASFISPITSTKPMASPCHQKILGFILLILQVFASLQAWQQEYHSYK